MELRSVNDNLKIDIQDTKKLENENKAQKSSKN